MDAEYTETGISEELKLEVEAALTPDRRVFLFGFSKELAELYSQYSLRRYRYINVVYPLLGALGILLFFYADIQLLPSDLPELFALRLLTVMLIGSVAWFVGHMVDSYNLISTYHKIQFALVSCAFVVHLVILKIGYIAAEQGQFHYQLGSLLIVILLCTVVRVDFRYLLPGIVLICASQMYFILYVVSVPNNVIIEHLFIFTAAAFWCGLANASIEYEVRRTFLQGLLIESDRQQLERTRDQLKQLSLSDPLTGVANRRKFDDEYEKMWMMAMRQKTPITLLMIDIDWFKDYNDTLGHMEGDSALVAVANAMANAVRRQTDFVARLGGEEFAIILPQTNLEDGNAIAELVRERVWQLEIAHPKSANGTNMSVSIGVASVVPGHNMDSQQLIKHADEQLYAAKDAGRNCVK